MAETARLIFFFFKKNGLISETFVLGATAPSEARSIPAKELGMKIDRSMKAASRFIPTKVEKSQRMTSHAANLPKPVKL